MATVLRAPAVERLRLEGSARLTAQLARLADDEIAWTVQLIHGWGWLFVAATSHGACRLELLEDAVVEPSLDRVRAEHRDATLRQDDDLLDSLIVEIVDYLRRPDAARLDLPVDVVGTPFQREVWTALRAIPQGRPLTYGQLAATLGKPHAARAVGAACGANAVALAIPCHRVIAEGHMLGGYRWGKRTKSRLLEMERRRRLAREADAQQVAGRRGRC